MGFILRLVVMTVAILLVAYLFPGVLQIEGIGTAVIAALVLAIINAVLRPIMIVLTLPIGILTLGLFTFVVNALMLWLVAVLVPGFSVSGFLGALLGSILISIVSTVLSAVVK